MKIEISDDSVDDIVAAEMLRIMRYKWNQILDDKAEAKEVQKAAEVIWEYFA